MNDLSITNYSFDPNGYFLESLDLNLSDIKVDWVSIFDQNGYILTTLEQQYYNTITEHRGPWEYSFQKPWITQEEKWEGAVLNHALIFQRKGFAQCAYDQLAHWSGYMPLIWKVAKIRPKWGLDFSIDWTDATGNVFEVLHWEWDDFSFAKVADKKAVYEQKFLAWDWDDIARSMLSRKDEWHHLGFFEQSNWKCDYLGIEQEQFKMVCWQ